MKFAEHTTCGEKGCSKVVGVREFDCGFFCLRHFLSSPSCSDPGCENPVHAGVYHGVGTKCRSCEFDYDGELEMYCESNLSAGEVWANTKDIHTK